MPDSPFLHLPPSSWVASNDHAFAIRDRYPVSPGHTLVVPHRLIPTWFEATRVEQLAILDLVDQVKRDLDAGPNPPAGYNVGFNAGEAAGQTVMHLHVHVIPRFLGDMDDPRGGVRHVIPSKGNYLVDHAPLATGGEGDPFARHVLPLLMRADKVAIVAAFVQHSGLQHIEHALDVALKRGAHVRLITGDYLEITQVSALELLLDWQSTAREGDESSPGLLETRVVEVERLPGRSRSFHPKSWHLEGPGFGVAFVGSSNLSRAALDTGIEWNLRVDRDRDRPAWTRVREAFESTWSRSRSLDAEWVAAYALRARNRPMALPPGELDPDPLPTVHEPHDVQREALDALRSARADGRRRALVVLATGLGKTWLAAYDYAQLWDELGRQPRLLFVAHRREILRQASQTFRALVRERVGTARVGWFLEERSDLSADLVFASVAKLSRVGWLERLADQRFDYVVVDEVHHATADSYRRILAKLDPIFLLGLTATPDRADAADVLGLFDDFVAHRAGIGEGIAVGRLVPFRYFGVKDDLDYANLPWRNGRFDPEELAAAVQTEARMATLWSAWQEHPGSRTLVFCCSVAHADFAAAWLARRGVRVAKVYSAPASDDRDDALKRLAAGDLDAICAIDVFNEGVDVPALDRVVMLRPTESGVVFLQQLGRGLRKADGKEALTVVDFVGNHRVFLHRLRALVSLASDRPGEDVGHIVSTGRADLPDGCSVELQLEAKRLLESLFRVGGADEVERAYQQLKAARGTRPTSGELLRMGYLPSALRKRHGSWFAWVRGEGDLSGDEARAVDSASAFLDDLEDTAMSKSFKMVTLEVLLEADALATGLDLADLATRAWALLRRSPELLADVPDDERPSEADPRSERRWLSYWRQNPIAAWTSAGKKKRTWFAVEGERLLPTFAVDAALAPLVRELVDYRLAQYRRRTQTEVAEGFVCKVTWNQRDPILKLDRRRATIPEGDTAVRLRDGSVWLFRFAKEFCNVARPAGQERNALPDLLRSWFGPRAGQPGTQFDVRFTASPDGLWVEPEQGNVIALRPRLGIAAYPDLRAAAGHARADHDDPDREVVLLPIEDASPELFAVRVVGTSMDGGQAPLRDGDWAVFRYARGAPADAFGDRVALVQVDGGYVIKRLVRADGRWRLTSDNPAGPTFDGADGMEALARLERGVRPEELAPPVGSRVSADELATRFGLPDLQPRSGRHGGHLFVFVTEPGQLLDPRTVASPAPLRPGETAYVLARGETGWRYLGVGRSVAGELGLAIPEVDFATWRAFGEGRGASRELPDGALERAQRVVDALVALPEGERVLPRGDRRARILGVAQKGGLRIDGGDDGFVERTVSLTDLAWVAVASDEVRAHGGLLDEARVNHLRYLEGTPKGSTRWIDTGWAIAAWALGAARADALEPRAASAPRKPRRADGTVVDATFRVERKDGQTTIVFESRGGTKGTADAVNTEYTEGLALILERLGAGGFTLADAALESRATAELPLAERRLDLGSPYPVALSTPEDLRRRVSAAQVRVGRAPDARGSGNATKRIRLWVAGAEDAAALADALVGP